MKKSILIVDDNDRYANNLKFHFEALGFLTARAYTAREGWDMFNEKIYDAVITDITMETQTSGLWLARKIFKSGYDKELVIATTGFDVMGVMNLSRYILPVFFGTGWMIPKKPLKAGDVIVYPTIKNKHKNFLDTLK